jgi:dipeptidyl aminopeptidase/acylaminoacyl peptidase
MGLLPALFLSLSCDTPVLEAAHPRAVPPKLVPVRGQPYLQFTVRDDLGRDIVAYLSEPPADGKPVPLAVYVQGSGCSSHFARENGRWTPRNGHMGLLEAAGGRFRVLLVEKPGVLPGDDPRTPEQTAGRPEFRREHTLERWTEALLAAVRTARTLPGIDRSRLLVVGHSEGGLVASRLARMLPEVTHVAVLAGGGPSQLADLTALVRRGTFLANVSSDPDAREAALRTAWEDILAHPDDPDRLFLGHAYPRWASFLASSPVEELSSVRWARVLVAQGLADDAVEPFTADVLTASLRVQGIDVTEVLVPQADHSFAVHGNPRRDGWRELLGQVTDWALS